MPSSGPSGQQPPGEAPPAPAEGQEAAARVQHINKRLHDPAPEAMAGSGPGAGGGPQAMMERLGAPSSAPTMVPPDRAHAASVCHPQAACQPAAVPRPAPPAAAPSQPADRRVVAAAAGLPAQLGHKKTGTQHEAAFEDISSAKNTDEMLRVVLRGSDIWMVSLQTLGKNDSSDISGCGTQLVACAERSRGLLRRAAAMPMQQLLGNPRLGVRLVLQLGSAAKALTKPAAKMEIGELLSRAREFEQLVEAACAAFDSCSRQARSGELVLHTVAANSVLLSSLLRQGIHQVDKMGIVINYTMPDLDDVFLAAEPSLKALAATLEGRGTVSFPPSCQEALGAAVRSTGMGTQDALVNLLQGEGAAPILKQLIDGCNPNEVAHVQSVLIAKGLSAEGLLCEVEGRQVQGVDFSFRTPLEGAAFAGQTLSAHLLRPAMAFAGRLRTIAIVERARCSGAVTRFKYLVATADAMEEAVTQQVQLLFAAGLGSVAQDALGLQAVSSQQRQDAPGVQAVSSQQQQDALGVQAVSSLQQQDGLGVQAVSGQQQQDAPGVQTVSSQQQQDGLGVQAVSSQQQRLHLAQSKQEELALQDLQAAITTSRVAAESAAAAAADSAAAQTAATAAETAATAAHGAAMAGQKAAEAATAGQKAAEAALAVVRSSMHLMQQQKASVQDAISEMGEALLLATDELKQMRATVHQLEANLRHAYGEDEEVEDPSG